MMVNVPRQLTIGWTPMAREIWPPPFAGAAAADRAPPDKAPVAASHPPLRNSSRRLSPDSLSQSLVVIECPRLLLLRLSLARTPRIAVPARIALHAIVGRELVPALAR